MARKAMFAGKFYAKTESELDKQITECFQNKNGPGDLPISKRTGSIKAIITPHAGYNYSGPCAAWAYKEIAESEFAELYIIIGPNHHSHVNAISMEGYETPFGLARVDQDFARKLIEKNDELKIDEQTHELEHSIEVQVPFLQFATKDHMHELKILPIIIGDIDYKKFALDLKELIMETDKKVIVIISSDFMHYGHEHHHIPFSKDVKENIYKVDGQAIELIKKLDSEGFLTFIEENHDTICGAMPIAIILKALKDSAVTLEQYYTSADLEEDQRYKNSVSYAAIVFK